MKKDLRGLIPPVVTPFTKDGEIDVTLLRNEMQVCKDAGVHGLSVGGSTGEGPTLSDEELMKLVQIAKEYVSESQPVVCGIMRTCTRDAVKAGLAAKEAGADVIMVTPTAYNVLVPDEEGNFNFYSTLSKEVQLPIIIYNVIPQNTVTPRLFSRLLGETEYVRGVKQSVGGIQALYAMIMAASGKGYTYAATDDMLASCFSLGADGAISAVLSVFPEYCLDMWRLVNEGRYNEALDIQRKIYPAWQCIAGNQFPIRVKYALSIMGRNAGYCRSPISHLSDEEKQMIEKAFVGL